MRKTLLRFAFAATLTLAPAACSRDGGIRPGAPGEGSPVTVEGVVTSIDDDTPADGGIRIDLRLDGGGMDVLYFGSLFTYPPPDEERMRLYEDVREVAVGNRVRARGTRGEGGITLEEITIVRK